MFLHFCVDSIHFHDPLAQPHTTPNYHRIQPRYTRLNTEHPNTRPITQPEGRAKRPPEGRGDELPLKGGRSSTPDREGRRWRTRCRRGGRGERATGGGEPLPNGSEGKPPPLGKGGGEPPQEEEEEGEEGNLHPRRGGVEEERTTVIRGGGGNVLSFHSTKGNSRAIQRKLEWKAMSNLGPTGRKCKFWNSSCGCHQPNCGFEHRACSAVATTAGWTDTAESVGQSARAQLPCCQAGRATQHNLGKIRCSLGNFGSKAIPVRQSTCAMSYVPSEPADLVLLKYSFGRASRGARPSSD